MVYQYTAKSMVRAALGCALGLAVVLAASPVRAGDDDDNTPIDTKILRGLLEGLGLQRDGQGIVYQERPPLVIPPNHDLPPPQTTDSVIANNPAWPVDPDVKRAKAEAASRRSAPLNPDAVLQAEGSPLPPDKIAPGPKPRNSRHVDDGYRPSPNGSSGPLTPSQLGAPSNLFGRVFGKDKPEVATFTGEPRRASLTDPPPGYQTPSPNEPYGKNTADEAPKAYNYTLQHGTDPD